MKRALPLAADGMYRNPAATAAPRTRVVPFRLRPEVYRLLELRARSAGVTPAGFLADVVERLLTGDPYTVPDGAHEPNGHRRR